MGEIEEPHRCPHCKSLMDAEWLVAVKEDGREFYACPICDYEPLDAWRDGVKKEAQDEA